MDTGISGLDLNNPSDLQVEKVDLSQNPQILDELVPFYNENFTKSMHSREFKERIYNDPSRNAVVFVIKSGGKIIGMIETWNDSSNPDRKVLATLLTDEKFRGRGVARNLFEKAEEVVSQDPTKKEWVLHFRESNKEKLIPYYTNLGFGNLTESGRYNNGEIKFEMTKPITTPKGLETKS
jgi:ribosomal protein S18 acetylase RimI-like enzyme